MDEFRNTRWRDDRQFEDKVIKTVDARGIGTDDGFYFGGIPKEKFKECPPLVGETVRMFGKGIGFEVRGVVLNPESDAPFVYYYRSEEEQDAKHKEWVASEQARKVAEFEKNRVDMDRRFDMLPKILQRRIELFRANCPRNFRAEFEPYELFVCEEAVKIANALKTEEKVISFARADHETQKQIVEDLSPEHSGNTFGSSAFLARCLVSADKALPFLAHGALTPLVGCKDYGCVHPRPELPNGSRAEAVAEELTSGKEKS